MANINIHEIRVKRGTTSQIAAYTGPIGELVLNTETNQLIAQDGVNAGGHLVTGDFSGIQANLSILQTEVANIAGTTGNISQLAAFFANNNLEEINASISTLQAGGYSNANVSAYLPNYGNNISLTNITAPELGPYSIIDGNAPSGGLPAVYYISSSLALNELINVGDRVYDANNTSNFATVLAPGVVATGSNNFNVYYDNFVSGPSSLLFGTTNTAWNFSTGGDLTLPGNIRAGDGSAIQFGKNYEHDNISYHIQGDTIGFVANTAYPAISWNIVTNPIVDDHTGNILYAQNTLTAPYSDFANVGLLQFGGPSGVGTIWWEGGAYSGNTAPYLNSLNLNSTANVVIGTNNESYNWTFSNIGELTLPNGGHLGPVGKGWTGLDGGNGQPVSLLSYYSDGMYSGCFTITPGNGAQITTYGDGTGQVGQWTFDNTGILTTSGDINAGGNITVVGTINFPYGNITSGTIGPGVTLTANVDQGQEFLGMFVGNTTNQEQGYIYVEQNSAGVQVTNTSTNQSYDWSFNGDGSMSLAGNLQFSDNSLQTTAYQGPAGQTDFATNASIGSYLTTNLPTYTGNLSVGNLTVAGNVNYVGAVNTITVQTGTFQGNAAGFGALYAGILSGYTYQPQTVLQNSTNFNGYAQVNHQNINSGANASTDYVATADVGNANYGFIDMGINSSGFVGGAGNELNYPLDGYILVQGQQGHLNGNLLLSTDNATDIVFSTNGQGSANEQARFKNNVGLIIKQTTVSTSTSTGALQVAGGAGIAGSLYVGSNLFVGASNIVATIATLQSNAAVQETEISGLRANITASNINIATLQTQIYSNANVSAYIAGNLSTINANITAANLIISTLQANVGAFETYANLTFTNFGNANVIANIQHLTSNISTTANIISPNYLFANGVNILSTVTGGTGTYSNTNVAAYIPTDPTITTIQANIGSFYAYANATYTGGGGSTYSNANVVSMLSSNSSVFIGNVNTYPLLSNVTQVFVGNNTAITSGNALYAGSTSILWNAYFAANGAALVRNTQTGTGVISMDQTGIQFAGYTGAVTANSVQTSLLNKFLQMSGTLGAVFSGIVSAPGVISTAAVALNSTAGLTTNQTTVPIVNATATTVNFAGAATTLNIGSAAGSAIFNGNLYSYGNVGNNTGNLTVRSQGTWNNLTLYGIAGGYNSPPYTNQSLTGGSGTGMTATYSSVGGYVSTITVTNAGSGYKNGDVVTLPGGLGSTAIVSNYNPNYSGQATATWLFGLDGNLTLPTNANINYANGVSVLSSPSLTYGNTQANALLSSGIVSSITATGNITAGNVTTTGTYTVASITTTGTYGNITGANVISANTISSVNFVYSANGQSILTGITGTYSNANVTAYLLANPITSVGNTTSSLSFATSGGNAVIQIGGVSTATVSQSQINVTGNVVATGNLQAANIIATQYGNSIGTTATYTGNVSANYFTGNGAALTGISSVGNIYGSSSNVTLVAGSYSSTFDNTGAVTLPGNLIVAGTSGPKTRFLWDTWQANSTSALSSFTPAGTIGGNAGWDVIQAYGLKLTSTVNSQSGYIAWNSSSINYNYDMTITASVGAGGGTGADGQWIYFGSNAATTGSPSSTGTVGGIAVMNHYYSGANQFEVYVNGTQTNIPYIGNGNYNTSSITLWNASYNSFYNLTVKIRRIQNGNRMLEIYLNEIYQGAVNIGNWTPAGNYFGAGAFTGGSNANNWVRQLKIDW